MNNKYLLRTIIRFNLSGHLTFIGYVLLIVEKTTFLFLNGRTADNEIWLSRMFTFRNDMQLLITSLYDTYMYVNCISRSSMNKVC